MTKRAKHTKRNKYKKGNNLRMVLPQLGKKMNDVLASEARKPGDKFIIPVGGGKIMELTCVSVDVIT